MTSVGCFRQQFSKTSRLPNTETQVRPLRFSNTHACPQNNPRAAKQQLGRCVRVDRARVVARSNAVRWLPCYMQVASSPLTRFSHVPLRTHTHSRGKAGLVTSWARSEEATLGHLPHIITRGDVTPRTRKGIRKIAKTRQLQCQQP